MCVFTRLSPLETVTHHIQVQDIQSLCLLLSLQSPLCVQFNPYLNFLSHSQISPLYYKAQDTVYSKEIRDSAEVIVYIPVQLVYAV